MWWTQADEVGVVYEQHMNYFSGKGAGAGRDFAGDRESRDLMEGNSKPVRVCFDGNIGVGKSTILKLLQWHPRLQEIIEILQEPIWEWQNVKGTGLNIFDAFYNDLKRYAFLFQGFVFTTRFLQQNKTSSESKADLLMMERSVLTDRCVFVKTSTEQGYFNPLEAAAYDVGSALRYTFGSALRDYSGEKLCPTALSALALSRTSGAHKSHLMRTT